MCGRFALDINTNKLKRQFGLELLPEIKSVYNITPTQKVLFLIKVDEEIHAELFQWGLIPYFAKDKKIKPPLINARAETVFEKPAFRKLVQSKRGIIVMSGFYEWHEEEGRKQPYYFKQIKDNYLAIAAFWDIWQLENEVIHTCCLVTTRANALGLPVHTRMPVILSEEGQGIWMNNEEFDKEQLMSYLVPYKVNDLVCYPVTPLMNDARFESKKAILPLD